MSLNTIVLIQYFLTELKKIPESIRKFFIVLYYFLAFFPLKNAPAIMITANTIR